MIARIKRELANLGGILAAIAIFTLVYVVLP